MKKSVKGMSFDGMVKFFLQYYRIPTRKDIEKLMDRIDSLEKLIKSKWAEAGRIKMARGGEGLGAYPSPKDNMSASDVVVEVLRAAGDEGASFSAIKEATGFEDKKLRNIIFRLNKLERIKRKSRGIYTV